MDHKGIFSDFFLLRLLINAVTMIALVHFVYYAIYKKKEFYFTFFLLNFIVFLLAYMLEKTSSFSSLSSAFGLLAAFSLLRFRTETISIKDMTYLFIIMTLGLINSVMQATYVEIAALNFIIISAVYVVDGNRIMRNQKFKTVEYDSLENIHPDRQEQLMNDLRTRTGLDIRKITIDHIDFGKGRVSIKIYFY